MKGKLVLCRLPHGVPAGDLERCTTMSRIERLPPLLFAASGISNIGQQAPKTQDYFDHGAEKNGSEGWGSSQMAVAVL